jgi:hypothetical protein
MGRVFCGAKHPGVKCSWAEMSMGRLVNGASCPWGELSMGRVFLLVSCPWGQLPMRPVFHGVSCQLGQLSMGVFSMGRVVHGVICLWGRIVRGANCPWDELAMGRYLSSFFHIFPFVIFFPNTPADFFSELTVNSTLQLVCTCFFPVFIFSFIDSFSGINSADNIISLSGNRSPPSYLSMRLTR